MDTKILKSVRESYGRCALDREFFDKFYVNFMGSSPEIPPFFTKTDMHKQKQLLREGISYMLLFADGSDGGTIAINKIGVIHDEKHVKVKPELYPLWINSLLKTIAEHDHRFNDELKEKWKTVLAEGIKRFTEMFRVK